MYSGNLKMICNSDLVQAGGTLETRNNAIIAVMIQFEVCPSNVAGNKFGIQRNIRRWNEWEEEVRIARYLDKK